MTFVIFTVTVLYEKKDHEENICTKKALYNFDCMMELSMVAKEVSQKNFEYHVLFSNVCYISVIK